MSDVHSGVPAVPSLPAQNSLSGLPPALPGQRAALRLLDVIDQITRHVQQLERRNQHATPQASAAPLPAANTPEILNLQRENATLKARQTEAKRRLEALLQRIEAAQAHETAEGHSA